MTLFLARLPAGADKPQIYEVVQPVVADRFYTPRAWAYRSASGSSIGVAALDDTPVKVVRRLAAHKKLDAQRRELTQTAFV
jgi:hypothetical protein